MPSLHSVQANPSKPLLQTWTALYAASLSREEPNIILVLCSLTSDHAACTFSVEGRCHILGAPVLAHMPAPMCLWSLLLQSSEHLRHAEARY